MAATEAQIRANRDNARKSTGPKTEAGKAKARMNALKHGMRSKEGLVLPHEDPAELDARILAWVEDWRPSNAIERELVERAAKASWALERAERYEATLISKRVRKAMLRSRAKGTARVGALGRKLFAIVGTPASGKAAAPREDEPAAIVAALEDSPEGVRWALDRWGELRGLIDGDQEWTYFDKYKFVRLLGKQPDEAADDPALNAIFLAWEALEEDGGVGFWRRLRRDSPFYDPTYSEWQRWRELASPPTDEDEARARLRSVIDGEVARLDERLAELVEAEDDLPERAEAASFLAGDAGERLRRYQSARSRELFRAVQLLSKLRKDAAQSAPTADPDHNGLPPSRGKVAAKRPDEGGSAGDSEQTAGGATEGGRPPHLTASRSVFPREGGRPSSAPLDPKRHDPRPALRGALCRRETGRDGVAASQNATNEPAAEEAEASLLQEVKSIIAAASARERTRRESAAG